MSHHVRMQIELGVKASVTHLTSIQSVVLVTTVRSQMPAIVQTPGELFLTDGTRHNFPILVSRKMSFKMMFHCETLAANVALVWFLARMDSLMERHVSFLCETFAADIT